jgi:hypothetical protein
VTWTVVGGALGFGVAVGVVVGVVLGTGGAVTGAEVTGVGVDGEVGAGPTGGADTGDVGTRRGTVVGGDTPARPGEMVRPVVVRGAVVVAAARLRDGAVRAGPGRVGRGPEPDGRARPVSTTLVVDAPDAGAAAPSDATIERNAETLSPATRTRVAAAGWRRRRRLRSIVSPNMRSDLAYKPSAFGGVDLKRPGELGLRRRAGRR